MKLRLLSRSPAWLSTAVRAFDRRIHLAEAGLAIIVTSVEFTRVKRCNRMCARSGTTDGGGCADASQQCPRIYVLSISVCENEAGQSGRWTANNMDDWFNRWIKPLFDQ